MDAVNDPKVKRIVGMFSAQMGKTTIIENIIGYHTHHDPCPIMVANPTLEMAETFSKDRLAPMIRDTPALKARFAEAGSKTSGDTLLHKKFPGGQVTLAGANSYNSLASRPMRIFVGDEAAKWKANEKGSPFRQSAARVKAFWNSKLIYFSTPTDASQENEFNEIWEQSDKRIFAVPCPSCHEKIVIAFDDVASSIPAECQLPRAVLRWDEGAPIKAEDGRRIRRAVDAWFECQSCRARIEDVARRRAVRSGEWVPTAQFFGTAGFWGWQGMSPFSNPLDIANEWLGALGSISALQSVKNETLGLPWAESGQAPDWKLLFDRRDDSYSLGTVPDGALVLTAGVDVQKDRIEIQVIGWGRHRQCWLVDYIILEGDTDRPEVWSLLTDFLRTTYPTPYGVEMAIRHLGIDSGYATTQVYQWARANRFSGVRVTVLKGGPETQTALVSQGSEAEISTRGQKLKAGVKVHSVNVSKVKSELHGRLNLPLPNLERGEDYADGFFHICALPDTEEYCRQLTAEHRVTRRTRGNYPKSEWEKTRPRNEALDTWNYNFAVSVLEGLDRREVAERRFVEIEASFVDKTPPRANPVHPAVIAASAPPAASDSYLGRRVSGGWLSR